MTDLFNVWNERKHTILQLNYVLNRVSLAIRSIRCVMYGYTLKNSRLSNMKNSLILHIWLKTW